MAPWRTTLFLLLSIAAGAAALCSTAHALRHYLSTGNATCLPHERDALLQFKRGITSDPLGVLASWQQGDHHDVDNDCCRWGGVRCSISTGHVLELRLPSTSNMSETYGNALVGQISPSLLSLHHLEHLDLSWNNLTGLTGHMPDFLGHLSNLRYLNLSYIPFSGKVPPQLGNLSKLHFLDISSPYQDTSGVGGGPLRSTDMSWLMQLPLRHLKMRGVTISGAVDWASVVNMIPSLRVLDLSSCDLRNADQSFPYLNLTNLEELDLSDNYIRHPISSCWFWNLTRLTHLELRRTHLYGQFPGALGRMTSLQVLDLLFRDDDSFVAPNNTYGRLEIMKANMTNLCNLESLNLRCRNMDTDINELFERLPQCSSNKLKELQLGCNKFTGVLPTLIGRWRSLLVLDLSLNNLTGQLPSEIGTLSNLIQLDLWSNNLNGVINHEHLAGLQSLKLIDLSDNSLKIVVDPEWLPPFRLQHAYLGSCEMGPLFPAWLQSQVDIAVLDISSAGIFDSIPDWFCTTFSKGETLFFSNNGINGTLPRNLAVLTSLSVLYLDSNQLTGQIPQFPRMLGYFDVSENSLSGPLPSNFGTNKLMELNIFSNLISGRIPRSVCDQENLISMNLGNNSLEGEFPECVKLSNIEELIVNNNKLSGKFPSFLKACTGLRALDLAWNQFSGQLPLWIGDFIYLEAVILSHNMFCDSIPATITKLRSLSHLNLANNSISGTLPRHLSNLTGMKGLFNDDNDGLNLNMPVITKGQERSYQITLMVSIDLSSNCITGKIPEEITSLDALVNLNLSRNLITGNIPDMIGVIHSLESLDLSENMLDGEIPPGLSNLSYLSYMDLSYNNLTGPVPSGGQLDTLYAQHPFIYDGNTYLCGPPLPHNCSDNSESKHRRQKRNENDSKLMSFYFGLSNGLLTGLWVVFCVMLFKKSWRIAYFCLLDKVYHKIYVMVVVTWACLAQNTASHQAHRDDWPRL